MTCLAVAEMILLLLLRHPPEEEWEKELQDDFDFVGDVVGSGEEEVEARVEGFVPSGCCSHP